MMGFRSFDVPTGTIFQFMGEKGKPLECLSLGDYGKGKNIKADFLGYKEKINGVPHGDLLPLEDKWVVTVSTQYGCSMGCRFCDVPKVGPGTNATLLDLLAQVQISLARHPEVYHTDRLNLHYARMGEPTFNEAVITSARILHKEIKERREWGFHPVVSTMLPRHNKNLEGFLRHWIGLKIEFKGDAGLQLSINTTDEEFRRRDFNGNALSLADASDMFKRLPPPIGRKFALNFALTGAPIDGNILSDLFRPDWFMCKLTPMHEALSAKTNGYFNKNMYSDYSQYEFVEENLKRAGYDVLVFVPSFEEDAGRITCGNAILSGTKPMMSRSLCTEGME